MLEIDSRFRIEQAGYWLCAAILVIAVKQFYSAATAAQLQWQLYPLVLLLETFSDLSFEATAESEWQDPAHRISIVKACAGVNFLIISLLGYWWLWRDRPLNIRLMIQALVFAWFTALLANTLRILLCLYGQGPLADLTGSSEEASHRFIGVAVYFLCLWAQLSAFRLQRFGPMVTVAALIYISVTLVIPLMRSALLGTVLPGVQHMLWVTGFPALMVILSLLPEIRSQEYTLVLYRVAKRICDMMPARLKRDMVADVHLILGKSS